MQPEKCRIFWKTRSTRFWILDYDQQEIVWQKLMIGFSTMERRRGWNQHITTRRKAGACGQIKAMLLLPHHSVNHWSQIKSKGVGILAFLKLKHVWPCSTSPAVDKPVQTIKEVPVFNNASVCQWKLSINLEDTLLVRVDFGSQWSLCQLTWVARCCDI